jgi:hypothetical protein
MTVILRSAAIRFGAPDRCRTGKSPWSPFSRAYVLPKMRRLFRMNEWP